MALNENTTVDKAHRILLAQGKNVEPAHIQSSFTEALKLASFKAIGSPFQSLFEDVLQMTLSAADAEGLQSAAIPATHFPASIPLLDRVAHSDLITIGNLILVSDIAHLKPPYVVSTSIYGRYFVSDQDIYVRRATGILATTSNALRARATKCITDISLWPSQAEPLIVIQLVVMLGGMITPEMLAQAV